jgi:hypothetical protein
MAKATDRTKSTLTCPDSIVDKAAEFFEDCSEQSLSTLLANAVCGSGFLPECEEGECDHCPGLAIMGHLENQLCRSAIQFVREQIQAWKEAHKETTL